MKKLTSLLLTLILAFAVFPVLGCDLFNNSDPNPVGFYQTHSMTFTSEGQSETYYAGEEVFGGVFHADQMMIQLLQDGTALVISNGTYVEYCSWQISNNTVTLSLSSTEQSLSFSDDTLSIVYIEEGFDVTYTLKKVTGAITPPENAQYINGVYKLKQIDVWQESNYNTYNLGDTYPLANDLVLSENSFTFTFNLDGTFTATNELIANAHSYNGTYYINDSTLAMFVDGSNIPIPRTGYLLEDEISFSVYYNDLCIIYTFTKTV
ncbi:MAG: hypothetical protein J6V68_03290 [Clostridia bacterium]|nr:hypothetical protein [Clostridia bacterium]